MRKPEVWKAGFERDLIRGHIIVQSGRWLRLVRVADDREVGLNHIVRRKTPIREPRGDSGIEPEDIAFGDRKACEKINIGLARAERGQCLDERVGKLPL